MNRQERECFRAMGEAADYATWREAALEVDRLRGFDDWKREDASPDYDWRLIKSRARHLRQLREAGEGSRLVYHLRQDLHWNLGNSGNPILYSYALVGTKKLIEDYIAEVVASLDYVCSADIPGLLPEAKQRFFAETAKSFGRSALMLSGGATLGLFHVGVVKALVREDLLPQVISGSSAGSIVAATVGTRAADALEDLLDPKSSYYHFWKPLSLREIWRKGVVMDQRQIRSGIAANIADLTFEEAHRISGRTINITISPAGSNQPPRLLNYLTSPYLYIREAVLASSAVPFLFEPVLLMTRDDDGNRVPYMPSLRWTDGSLKSDLPTLRLRRLHNVNHFIVSQTNPHVIPFVSGGMEQQGPISTVRDVVFSSLRGSAKHAIGIGRFAVPLETVRTQLDNAASVIDQDYRGNITIIPKVTVWRYAHVTANPKMEAVVRFIKEGERATWKRLPMIRNQTLIARTLERCIRELAEAELHRSPARRREDRERLRLVQRQPPAT